MTFEKAFRQFVTCKATPRIARRHLSIQWDTRQLVPDDRRIIFSGIQPTGVPHLGNYLGALRSWVELQDVSKHGDLNYYCVVDLHALTQPQDPAKLLRWRVETFASLLAVGLDPKRSNIFFQSQVTQHSELMWLLSTMASTGMLSRMTQWKTKLDLSEDTSMGEGNSTQKLKLGLFSYPVLQAADILLYDATHVPIGADQVQHLEFTRNLARSFNSQYGKVNSAFTEPEAILSPAKRIMSLTDPTKKMSKSNPDANSRILITDKAEVIYAKIKAAVTDSEDSISYDVEKRPGISNLLGILSHTSQKGLSPVELAQGCQNLSKKAFKALVADSVVTCLAGIRERYKAILASPSIIQLAAERGTRNARTAARLKVDRVGRLMGLGPTNHVVGESAQEGAGRDTKDEARRIS